MAPPTLCRSYPAQDMAPPHHQATTIASWILLLWVSAVALFPCSSCQVTEAGGTLPPPAPAGGYCSRTEASSLLQLFPGLNITAELPSWRLGTDCCSWEGIKCERGRGHVVGLHLGDRLITAHVDASKFLGLPRLSSINLSWNILDYSSSFPSVLAGLPNLTHLNISMEGTLALEFPRLPRLVSLDLSPNPPAYELKLANGGLGTLLVNGLPGLQELHLDFVDLSDGSAGWCRALASALPKLQVLTLRRCSLSVDADCLSQLSYLSEIYLDLNDFSSGLPSFGSNFSSLRALSLSGCGLTGRVPKDLLWLPKLEILDLSSNSITGDLPEFSPTSVLQVLTLALTGLSGELPASIGYLESMKELELAGCNLTGQIPNSTANLGNINSLDLSGNNLSGPIPPALGGLKQLVLFDLSDNSLSGHIPAGMLSSSAKLEVVRLQDNQLTGPVPTPDPEKLSRLTTLNLQNNSLSGSFPSSLLSLPSLQSLLLNKNQLGGQLEEIPNAISSVLEEIDLSDNKLRGEIPSSVFKLPVLRTLSLSFNQFNGTLELSMLQNATVSKLDLSYNLLTVLSKPGDADSIFHSFMVLNLASCNLSGFPDFLRGQYQAVSFLDLSNNKIGGEIPTWIWQVMDGPIRSLNLSHNLLEGFELPLPDTIQYNNFDVLDLHSNLLQGPLVLPGALGFLDYSNNRFASTFPEDIGPLLSSEFISFSGNRLGGKIPPSICNASSLQVLDLSDNEFSGMIPPCLANSSTLDVLNLRGNRFDGMLPQNFGNGCSLSTLDLSENQLRGQLPRSLANCGQLEVLNLRQNDLVDIFPSWLGELPSLRVLVLRSNRFHGGVRCDSTLPAGDGFRSVQILDLSSNGFAGDLPSDCFDRFKEMMSRGAQNRLDIIRHGYYQDSVKITLKGEDVEIKKILNILAAIDLSGNRFRGEIPGSMGKLERLVLLNISGNGLGGPIPAALGDLANLESLDLSRNMLTGKIPDQLTRLTFLSILNLSYNRLSGRIPPGGQLSTFPNSSFEGNAGLCGRPLSRGCGGDGGIGEGPQPAAAPAAPTNGLDWGSGRIAFALGAGMGVSCCPIFLWKKGFFDAHGGWSWGRCRRR